VASKDVPQDSGLKVAPCGLNNTIVIDSTPVDHFNILNLLDVVCSIDVFRNVSLRTMKDVILAADKEVFKPGQTVNISLKFKFIYKRLLMKERKQIYSSSLSLELSEYFLQDLKEDLIDTIKSEISLERVF